MIKIIFYQCFESKEVKHLQSNKGGSPTKKYFVDWSEMQTILAQLFLIVSRKEEKQNQNPRLWAIAHKYSILPLFWKLSTIAKIHWFASTYFIHWAGGGCPARFWIISTLIMFYSVRRRLIKFQKTGWHDDTSAWKRRCHPSTWLLVLGSLTYVLWNIFHKFNVNKRGQGSAFLRYWPM